MNMCVSLDGIVGDSLLGDAKLALEALNDAIPEVKSRPAPGGTTHRTKTSNAAE